MTLALASPPTTGYMFGIDSYYDGPCASDYNPWMHAEMLGATIVSNMTLPREMAAAYSYELDVIFFRAGLPEDVEYCAITHELVHFEHKDKGKSRFQEDRAEKTTALRLIRPSRLSEEMEIHGDIAEAARNMRVTEKTMRLYMRMVKNGTLPSRP